MVFFFIVFSVIYLFDSSAVQAAVELFESLRVDFLIVVVGPFDAVGVEVALEPGARLDQTQLQGQGEDGQTQHKT